MKNTLTFAEKIIREQLRARLLRAALLTCLVLLVLWGCWP